jgi:hypothetical protein
MMAVEEKRGRVERMRHETCSNEPNRLLSAWSARWLTGV